MARRFRMGALMTFASGAAFVAVACGIDALGTRADPDPVIDTGLTEASLPPRNDATPPGDAGSDTASQACASTEGPTMVEVIVDGGRFCIDSTEVTNAQYAKFVAFTANGVDAGFLDASVYDGGLPSYCFPRQTYKKTVKGALDEPAQVSWCDAFGYCQWSGKRMCQGKTAAAGGEWRRACTRDRAQPLPYGSVPEAGACNVAGTAKKPVKSSPRCEGGYAGVYDMVGNLEEWVDDCPSVAGSVYCAVYGADWGKESTADCNYSEIYFPNSADYLTGIRCCR